jgi:hypothetical protein
MSPISEQPAADPIARFNDYVICLGILNAFYIPSLWFGFQWDDYLRLQVTWSEAWAWISERYLRPYYWLAMTVENYLPSEPVYRRLVTLFWMNVLLIVGCRLARKYQLPFAPLVICTIFLHPSFVYPFTWISQKLDMYLLILMFLSFINLDRGRGLLYLALSNLAKTPFVFHNLWYAWYHYRAKSPWWFWVLPPLLIVPFLVHSGWWWFTTMASGGFNSPLAHLEVPGLVGVGVALLARGAKLIEGIVTALVPFPAYYGSNPAVLVAAGAAYVGALGSLLVLGLKRMGPRHVPFHFLAVAFLTSIPFAINNWTRVLVPAIPFFYLALFMAAGRSRTALVAGTVLLALNTTGSALNYRFTDTGDYVGSSALDYKPCKPFDVQFPMEHWTCDRFQLASRLVAWVNGHLK